PALYTLSLHDALPIFRETLAEVDAVGAQIAAEERAIALQKEELVANEELLRQNYVQKTRVLTLQRAVAEYEAKHGEHRAELSREDRKSTRLNSSHRTI